MFIILTGFLAYSGTVIFKGVDTGNILYSVDYTNPPPSNFQLIFNEDILIYTENNGMLVISELIIGEGRILTSEVIISAKDYTSCYFEINGTLNLLEMFNTSSNPIIDIVGDGYLYVKYSILLTDTVLNIEVPITVNRIVFSDRTNANKLFEITSSNSYLDDVLNVSDDLFIEGQTSKLNIYNLESVLYSDPDRNYLFTENNGTYTLNNGLNFIMLNDDFVF